ncbi:hypothetical protein N0V90_011785 [Kalmusia sp. IMI 367209]|nr:hypothetical protein N0V90_011785 [Kalmusia sp. IMI 367209]
MIRSYVCRQCRLQISRRLNAPRTPQWQPKATFISLRNSQSRPNAETPKSSEEVSNEGIGEQEKQDDGSRIRYNGQRLVRFHKSQHRNVEESGAREQNQEGHRIQRERAGYSTDAAPAPLGRYSRSARRAGPPSPLNQEQHNESYKQDPRNGGNPTAYSNTTSSFAQSIDRHLKNGSVKAAWDVFDENYTSRDVPALTDPSLNDVSFLTGGKIFSRLYNAIATEFVKGNRDVPAPTMVLFRYEQLEIAQPDMWYRAIAYMTDQLLWSMTDSNRSKGNIGSIVSELLSLWRLLFQRYGTERESLETIGSEWKLAPDVQSEDGNLTGNFRTRTFGSRMQQHHPAIPSKAELQFSAIIIFNYFHGDNQFTQPIPDSLREQNAPFLQLLTKSLVGSNVTGALNHTQVSSDFRRLPEAYRKTITDQIGITATQAMKVTGMESVATPEEQASQLQEFFLKRIARMVLEQANASGLERLWSEAEVMYQQNGKPAVPPAVYNAFLSGFMTLFQPDSTVKVWNHMIANGVQPDSRTWNAMLDGCAKANDLNGLNAVWDRMMRSGVEPDNYAWTTRVHALISNREVNQAFAAMDDMGKKWLSAKNAINDPPKQDNGKRKLPSNAKLVNRFTKPSIEVINGAISALIQNRRRGLNFETKASYVHKVLQWAGNFGIKPDVRTYNSLIQLYLSANDYPTTFKLLRQMEREGIEGDLATHSMLLRAAFDSQKFDSLSQLEQADRVFALFAQLEQGGLKLNQYVYQVAVDRLLKHYGNYNAVRMVIDHMFKRGLQPSPQIYTSLVTHYFQQDPPDIPAVDSLVARIFGPPAAPTDKFLFDRIIEGYAANGEVGAMMTVLTKMSKHGKLPSFHALTEVVKALINAGDWERARAIVRDVQTEEGVAKGGPTGGSYGRKQFFYMVQVLGGELTESLAGEHLRAPVKERDGGVQTREKVADVMRDDASGVGQRDMYEEAPQEQAPLAHLTQEMDQEPMEGEHAGYLSDELETPQRRLKSANRTDDSL